MPAPNADWTAGENPPNSHCASRPGSLLRVEFTRQPGEGQVMASDTKSVLARCVRSATRLVGAGRLPDELLLQAFVLRRDESAFAALVRRHGPLVLSACRQVTRDGADAEDAFQATFLLLSRKAAALRRPGALAGWLFRVARRAALAARQTDTRRKRREAIAQERRQDPPPDDRDLSWREACAILHEELDRLPEKYRLPLVLCYLQGLTRDQAAGRLGWSVGALIGRLERGRQALRLRLQRRGVALSAGLLAALTGSAAGEPAPRLVEAALGAAAGRAPAAVAELARGAAPAAAGRLVPLAAALVAAGLLAAAVWRPAAATSAPADPPKPPAARPAEETVTVAGRVLGPDGKPAASARLFVLDGGGRKPAPQPAAGPDGRFRFGLGPPPVSYANRYLMASADGLGCDWAAVAVDPPPGELTLRLPPDVPIKGRVLDLEGRPVAGAAVRVAALETTRTDNLDEFLTAWRTETADPGRAFRLLEKRVFAAPALAQMPEAKTDADGRFTVSGYGRDRAMTLRFSGPGIADQW